MNKTIGIIIAVTVLCASALSLVSCAGSPVISDITAAPTEKKTENSDQTSAEPAVTDAPQTADLETEEPKMKRTFVNPRSNESAPDPFIIYNDGYYYCLRTEVTRVRLYRHKNAEDVILKGEYKDLINTGDPICDGKTLGWNCWAPEIHFMPTTGRWYVYFVASTDGFEFGAMRMMCLESDGDDPFGDYSFKALTDPDLLAIDQTVWYDEKSGEIYTVFSEYTDKGQSLTLAVMDNPWHISDKRIMLSYARYAWEKRGKTEVNDSRINEGPEFLIRNGKIYLIYSASGCWSQYYCLGMLTYKGPDTSKEEFLKLENWEKSREPVFSKANKVYGPGHCSFFESPDGTETWMAYHGMATPDAGVDARFMYLQKISFDENDVPVFGKPVGRGAVLEAPSGEE
ncbi:MAG: glycoside hydrolase family 43 protein [Clostridia bacterium]|nr:glycoside hydrolase family 43 protein [Clostridia bacterium]